MWSFYVKLSEKPWSSLLTVQLKKYSQRVYLGKGVGGACLVGDYFLKRLRPKDVYHSLTFSGSTFV